MSRENPTVSQQHDDEDKYHSMKHEGPKGKSCLENAFKTSV